MNGVLRIVALTFIAAGAFALIAESTIFLLSYWRALRDFILLQKWLMGQTDDCSMSNEKWKSLRPVCQFADARLMQYTRIPDKATCKAFVECMIEDEEEPENASA